MNRVSDLPFPFLITNQNKIKKKKNKIKILKTPWNLDKKFAIEMY